MKERREERGRGGGRLKKGARREGEKRGRTEAGSSRMRGEEGDERGGLREGGMGERRMGREGKKGRWLDGVT